jgi:hypothetical protein
MQPRLTFLLGRPGDTAAAATLSSAGKLIGNLLQSAEKEGAPTALVSKTPVMTLASNGTPQIASALKDSLSFSGLFYESHLSQWVQGSRPLSDLIREPQAAGSPAAKHAAAMATADGMLKEQDQTVNAARDERSGTELKTSLIAVSQGIDSDSTTMISLQLQTLEQQRVQWQGELWPGQPLEWEVKRDARGHEGEPERQSWQSVVRFELPNLGVVSATIQLNGDHVQMHVRAAAESTAASLGEHRAELASALDAAGSRLDLFTVKQDPSI